MLLLHKKPKLSLLAAAVAAVFGTGARTLMADAIVNQNFNIPGDPLVAGSSEYAYANPTVTTQLPLREAPFGHTGVSGWYFGYGAGVAAGGTDPNGFGVTGLPAGFTNAAFLQGGTDATISQKLTPNAVGTVTVDFFLEGRSNYNGVNTPVEVSLGPDSPVSISNISTGSFVQYSETFLNVSAGSVLTFTGMDLPGGDNSTFVAGVSLPGVQASTPLPKAASAGFGMLALFGSLAAARKRLMGNRTIA